MIRRYHMHMPGLVYAFLVTLVGLAALNSQANLLFWVFGVMLSALALSGIVSGVMMMGLDVRRLDPRHGSVGEPLIVRYAVRNRNRLFPLFNVHIEERQDDGGVRWRDRLRGLLSRTQRNAQALQPEEVTWGRLMDGARAWVMHVGPRETVHGEAFFWPRRRGAVRFGAIRVWTTFPFGIIKKSVTVRQRTETLVYPRVFELRRGLIESLSPRGPMGIKVSSHAGAGDDYFGVREYRPGDSLRHIAWKRAAGQDQLVSIERTRPSPPKLRVVLNLTTPREEIRLGKDEPWTAESLEERAISLAASVIHAADRAGFEVGLSVLGLPVPSMPLRRNQWHLEKMMGALAGLDLERPREDGAGRVPDAERAAVVVVHPDRAEPAIVRQEAWHLTARQLDGLLVAPISDAIKQSSEKTAVNKPAVETAA